MTVQKQVKQAASKTASTAKAVTAVKKASPAKPDFQIYVSSDEEIMNFDVVLRGVRYTSFWDADKEHIMFKIKDEHVEAFESHEHFVRGRFIKFED